MIGSQPKQLCAKCFDARFFDVEIDGVRRDDVVYVDVQHGFAVALEVNEFISEIRECAGVLATQVKPVLIQGDVKLIDSRKPILQTAIDGKQLDGR